MYDIHTYKLIQILLCIMLSWTHKNAKFEKLGLRKRTKLQFRMSCCCCCTVLLYEGRKLGFQRCYWSWSLTWNGRLFEATIQSLNLVCLNLTGILAFPFNSRSQLRNWLLQASTIEMNWIKRDLYFRYKKNMRSTMAGPTNSTDSIIGMDW